MKEKKLIHSASDCKFDADKKKLSIINFVKNELAQKKKNMKE